MPQDFKLWMNHYSKIFQIQRCDHNRMSNRTEGVKLLN